MSKHQLPSVEEDREEFLLPPGYKAIFDADGNPHILQCSKAAEIEPDCMLCVVLPIGELSVAERMREPCFNSCVVSAIFDYLHGGGLRKIQPYGDCSTLTDYEKAADILCLHGLKAQLSELRRKLCTVTQNIKYEIRKTKTSSFLYLSCQKRYAGRDELIKLGLKAWMKRKNFKYECEIPLPTLDLEGTDWYTATKDLDVDPDMEGRFLKYFDKIDHPHKEGWLGVHYKAFMNEPRAQRGNPYHFVVPFLANCGWWETHTYESLKCAFGCNDNIDLLCKILSAMGKVPLPDGTRLNLRLFQAVTEYALEKCEIASWCMEASNVDRLLLTFYSYPHKNQYF